MRIGDVYLGSYDVLGKLEGLVSYIVAKRKFSKIQKLSSANSNCKM